MKDYRKEFIGPFLPHLERGLRYWWATYKYAKDRLIISGKYGLPVGKDTRHLGGCRTDWTLRQEASGVAYLERDSTGRIKRIYPCQLSFDFMYDIR